MDGWQAAQNWIGFSALAGGVGLYYYITRKQTPSRPSRAASQQHNAPATLGAIHKQPSNRSLRGKKQKTEDTNASSRVQSSDPRAADSETNAQPEEPKSERSQRPNKTEHADRDFVKQMLQARQGIDVKSSDKTKGDRPRTIKPKGSTSLLSSGSSQTDGEEGEWSEVAPPSHKASGVEDMLEAPASGPSTLRITASTKPTKSSTPRQPKKEVVETKKQRQNRQKIEQQRQQREEDERQRRALEEKQRRAAREARGEPAKNGISIPAAPSTNPWSASSSRAQSSTTVIAATSTSAAPTQSVPLLDTFDAESTASSNDAQVSTAATSTTDGIPAQWGEEPLDDRFHEALIESGPWEEAPASKRKGRGPKNAVGATSASTSSGAPLIVNGSGASKNKEKSQPNNGYAALNDEADVSL